MDKATLLLKHPFRLFLAIFLALYFLEFAYVALSDPLSTPFNSHLNSGDDVTFREGSYGGVAFVFTLAKLSLALLLLLLLYSGLFLIPLFFLAYAFPIWLNIPILWTQWEHIYGWAKETRNFWLIGVVSVGGYLLGLSVVLFLFSLLAVGGLRISRSLSRNFPSFMNFFIGVIVMLIGGCQSRGYVYNVSPCHLKNIIHGAPINFQWILIASLNAIAFGAFNVAVGPALSEGVSRIYRHLLSPSPPQRKVAGVTFSLPISSILFLSVPILFSVTLPLSVEQDVSLPESSRSLGSSSTSGQKSIRSLLPLFLILFLSLLHIVQVIVFHTLPAYFVTVERLDRVPIERLLEIPTTAIVAALALPYVGVGYFIYSTLGVPNALCNELNTFGGSCSAVTSFALSHGGQPLLKFTTWSLYALTVGSLWVLAYASLRFLRAMIAKLLTSISSKWQRILKTGYSFLFWTGCGWIGILFAHDLHSLQNGFSRFVFHNSLSLPFLLRKSYDSWTEFSEIGHMVMWFGAASVLIAGVVSVFLSWRIFRFLLTPLNMILGVINS